jgi:predicted lactoylglutathione lyase
MRMIFVNLPVRNLEASKAFFSALGFGFDTRMTDENAACMIVSETSFVMLLTQARFRDFITGEISDAHKATEVLTCLSAESREEVDDLLARALAAGAKPWKPAMDYGFMYGVSFQDLDGHVWELMHMDVAAQAG